MSTYPANPNMVLGQDFESNFTDFTGNGNDGTANNVSLVDGKAAFNGIDGNIKYPISDSLTGFTQKSVFFMITPSAFTGSDRYVYDAGYWTSDYGDRGTLDDANNIISLLLRNTTGTIASDGFTYNLNEPLFAGYTWDGNIVKYYYGSPEYDDTDTFIGVMNCSSYNMTVGSRYIDSNYLNDDLSYFYVWDYALSDTEVTHLYTSVNGTAARTLPNSIWTPVVDGSATLLTDDNVSSIEAVDSNSGTYDYGTFTGTFTEPTTLISESEDDDYVYVNITHTAGNNASSGNVEYTITSTNETFTATLDSDNPNATVNYHDDTINVNTGALVSGEEYYYNVTINKNSTIINPPFVATVSVIVAVVGLFVNRFRRRF